jgi:hypothetical protein
MAKIEGASVPVVFVRVGKDKHARFQQGECFTASKFDEVFGGLTAPNRLFGDVLAGTFEYTSHSADSIRMNLADQYRTAAGLLRLRACGKCEECDPASVAASLAATSAASSVRASLSPKPQPSRPSEIDELGDATRPGGECQAPRRRGNIDSKGAVLTSMDTRGAFVNAHRNADTCVFPLDLIPRTLPKLNLDGSAKLDLRGIPQLVTQQGTQYVENVNGRLERVLSAGGGYAVQNATNMGLDFTTSANVKSRQDLCGEPNLGHSKLSIVDTINANIAAVGLERYFLWCQPPGLDDGRRYFGDYGMQQNPSF